MVVVLRIKKDLFMFKVFLLFFVFLIVLIILHVFGVLYNLMAHKHYCFQNEPIDVVYTWVNGSDPIFMDNLWEFVQGKRNNPADFSPQRYDDKLELKFSLRSLEKYAPWINHVYIVTNGQIPYWLNLDYEKVSIISHSQIFKDKYNLPTFSSPAIESNLHRIPGLSKRFIYFNDDIFLDAPVYPEDFYSQNKGFLVYLAWPIPMCAPSCQWMYVHDYQCDKACFNPNCQMDGGDCDGSNMDVRDTPRPFSSPSFSIRSNYTNLLHHANLSRAIEQHNQRILSRNKIRKAKRVSNGSAADLNTDAYSASLQHTHRLFNRKFGFRSRKVPAHAPILIDRRIMEELQRQFQVEFVITERNRVRSHDDLQFSFSYYYFLMSEVVRRDVSEVFEQFDTDLSGTLSDRELRTLLTNLYQLPLSYGNVDHFEAMLVNCSARRASPDVSTPLYERYIDSKLPTVSKDLVLHCNPLVEMLEDRFGTVSKYRFEVVHRAESKFVTFKMLTSNVSDVVWHLDDIRSSPRKFVCLNDNLDGGKTDENELVKSILYDFYVSLFPLPSQFELDNDYRNKFLYMDDLIYWRNQHYVVKCLMYFICFLLISLLFYNIFRRRICQCFNKKFCF